MAESLFQSQIEREKGREREREREKVSRERELYSRRSKARIKGTQNERVIMKNQEKSRESEVR